MDDVEAVIIPDDAKSGEPAPDVPAEAGQAVVGGRPEDPAKQVTTGGMASRVAVSAGTVLSALSVLWNYINGNPNAAVTGIICVTALILIFVFRQIIMDYARLQLGADPSKYNVK